MTDGVRCTTVGPAKAEGSLDHDTARPLETHIGVSGTKTYATNLTLSNQVNYRHFLARCYRLPDLSVFYKHEVEPVSCHALEVVALQKPTSAVPATWSCTRMANQSITKVQGKNREFSAGVDAPFLSLSAQAAYSHETTVSWNFPGGGLLCGSTNAGYAAAPEEGSKP